MKLKKEAIWQNSNQITVLRVKRSVFPIATQFHPSEQSCLSTFILRPPLRTSACLSGFRTGIFHRSLDHLYEAPLSPPTLTSSKLYVWLLVSYKILLLPKGCFMSHTSPRSDCNFSRDENSSASLMMSISEKKRKLNFNK